jgi:hemin uptake protein HemP
MNSLPSTAPQASPSAETPGRSTGSAPVPVPHRWTSRELLGSAREVEIEHEGLLYRLRLTSLGKLILTK